jgi:hypothetical protein
LAAEEVIISLKAQVHILQAKLGHYQTWLASVHIKAGGEAMGNCAFTWAMC